MNVDHCLYGSFCVFAGKPFPILLGSTPSLGITAGSDGIVRLSSTYSHFCRHKCLGNITGRFTAFESLNHPGYFLSHYWFILKLQYATERFVLCPYCHAISYAFLHNRPWKSAWIKSISSELDITIHVITSQFSFYCDVISNQLWDHHHNEDWASETQARCVKIIIYVVIYGFYGFAMSCKK